MLLWNEWNNFRINHYLCCRKEKQKYLVGVTHKRRNKIAKSTNIIELALSQLELHTTELHHCEICTYNENEKSKKL